MRLTLFDLDNTLINGDSDFEWAQFLIAQGHLDGAEYDLRSREFFRQYQDGSLNIHDFLAFQLAPLARYPRRQLERRREQFVSQRILALITPAARELVARERRVSQQVAIVTATNRFVTAPIAELFGIDALIATEAEVDHAGDYTGRASGTPSFREGKISRVDAWLEDQGLSWSGFAETAFYSDSLNDLPLLSRVSHPVAVDPDATLAAHARQHGWPIISLRDSI